jgi:nitroimidazol reductase NimA-like FMN-containing flavoprotein (pyridoxamine 5'-phosphate oxidase superfamily)
MADYGVPTDTADALPWTWAEQRLVANRNYWVVTATASARPHALPVWGVWLPETERFLFSCSPNSRKARNILENPQCVVTVDDTVECISVEGRARTVDPNEPDDAKAVNDAITRYVSKYWNEPTDYTAAEAFVRSNAIIEVTPDRAFGIIEREDEFARRATRWRW